MGQGCSKASSSYGVLRGPVLRMNSLVLIAAVLLLALSQLLQKIAAESQLKQAKTTGDWLRAIVTPPLSLAIACIVLGTILWLFVLYTMDLSRAYPFLGAGTVIVVALSRIWLGEHVSILRWLGVILIAIGISLVAGT